MIEPPVTPANLEMIRDLISEAADSDLTVAACWLPELRCAWVGRIVAGVCVLMKLPPTRPRLPCGPRWPCTRPTAATD